jgi:hypothetical protein
MTSWTVKRSLILHKVRCDWLTAVLTAKTVSMVRQSIMFKELNSRLNLLATRTTHLIFLLLVTLTADHFFIAHFKTTKNKIILAFLANETLLVPMFVTMGHSFLSDRDFLMTTLAFVGEVCCVTA